MRHVDAHTIDRIIRAASEEPWAILESKLVQIRHVLSLRAAGYMLDANEIAERIAAPARPTGPQAGSTIAVIPVVGVLTNRGEIQQSSGVTGIQGIAQAFRAALATPSVSAIVLDVDSPGGGVFGVEEFAEEIYRSRDVKPTIAVANPLAASGAFWIATAASEFVAAPSAQVGSLGVYSIHVDESAALEAEGLKVTVVQAGRLKTSGAPWAPLDEEARQLAQERVDTYYRQFVDAVARNRGVSARDVLRDYGEGAVMLTGAALERGVIDRVGTLESELARLGAMGPAIPRERGTLAEEPTRVPHASVIETENMLAERGLPIRGKR